MAQKQARQEGTDASSSGLEAAAVIPIVASARTGLTGKDDAIVRKLPPAYLDKSVREAIEYITTANITGNESALAQSVRKGVGATQSVVMINGKTADLDKPISQYIVNREHALPGGAKKQYKELEIEVSEVNQGGLYTRLYR